MRRSKNAPTAPALRKAAFALTLLACETPPAPARVPSPPPPVASAKPAAAPKPPPGPTLPPGVLAQMAGKTGVVRVVEKDGFRLLTIDDTVHAAHYIGPADAPLAAYDPIVPLLVSARREQRSNTLVVGLGSGATAAELTTVGHKVEVAEIEPAVIELARRFFAYQGHAEAVDGVEWLKKTRELPYDLILLDAFAGERLPRPFLDPDVVRAVRAQLSEDGVVALRLIGAPRDEAVIAAVRAFGGVFPHRMLYGTGAADEPQNLYLFLSGKPLGLFNGDLGLTFVLPLPDLDAPPAPAATEEARRDVVLGRRERRVSLVGYLVRGEDGALCLDLPHWDMGARRFLLEGPEAERLRKLLPANLTFPTAGDLSSDGPLEGTLYSLLGGGGVKLSTVRFSPIAVAVEGKLSSRKPETSGDPRDIPRDAFNPRTFMESTKKITANARGVIAVDKVHFTLDTAGWRSFRQKNLKAPAERAKAAFVKGDLAAGAKEVRAMIAALDKQFGRFAPRLLTYDELATLGAILPRSAPSGPISALRQAEACDRARTTYRDGHWIQSWSVDGDKERRDLGTMLVGLFDCATRKYEQAIGPSPQSDSDEMAAARLVELLQEASPEEFDEKQRDAFYQRGETLNRKWFPVPRPKGSKP